MPQLEPAIESKNILNSYYIIKKAAEPEFCRFARNYYQITGT
jgi:hypothetical protein